MAVNVDASGTRPGDIDKVDFLLPKTTYRINNYVKGFAIEIFEQISERAKMMSKPLFYLKLDIRTIKAASMVLKEVLPVSCFRKESEIKKIAGDIDISAVIVDQLRPTLKGMRKLLRNEKAKGITRKSA